MNSCDDIRERRLSLELGVGVSGVSSLLVCQEFVSQLNRISTQTSTNLAIYIYLYTVYNLQS